MPEPIKLSSNLYENWKCFKLKVELFLNAAASKERRRNEAAKAAVLLSESGDKALDVFNNFKFQDGNDQDDYPSFVRSFEGYFAVRWEDANTLQTPPTAREDIGTFGLKRRIA
ncbi:hypothetical protein HPB47_009433 [Ixodes persulcatus]|uniref:Uncharacterized protein n=1 Tax=Ixodes persulcatus TaxID=34615 RepID=A0AC60P1W0_IXOPE|nr:hypothetical protein HPB47_009433 [Ixodes persulcatus]